jgi:2-keto-4-pentenoate hydratase/2-oxohepta-3-ene-1,7-dioic acid hydratase in catechol pathway
MTNMNKRVWLQGSMAAAVAATTGCAGPTATAPNSPTQRPSGPFQVEPVSIPIAKDLAGGLSGQTFPVRRIYCIGRNYEAHAREMGSDPNREPPFFFQKPTDAIQYVTPGQMVDHPYPSLTRNYHHEVELVAALQSGGRDIPVEQALRHVYGYALGLDMTRRDLQRAMGNEKKPWEIGKSFDHSAPIGPVHPVATTGHFQRGAIWIQVNGQVKQSADLSQMIWSVAEQISKLSQAFELKAGDIIYAGTPENVGPVVRGDEMHAHIDGLPDLRVRVI